MVQHSGGVQLYDLVVLHSQVMAGAFKVSDLRERNEKERKERKKTFTVFSGDLFNVCF